MSGGSIETKDKLDPIPDRNGSLDPSLSNDSRDILRRSSARITRTLLAHLRSHFTRELESSPEPSALPADHLEQLRIFAEKARSSDVIRSLMTSDRIITISGIGDGEKGSDLRIWSASRPHSQDEPRSSAPALLWEVHFDEGISCITPSPSETLVVIGTKGLVGVYSLNQKDLAMRCTGSFEITGDHPVKSMSFSRDGRYLDVASQDGILRILSVENGGKRLKEMACFYIDSETNSVMDRAEFEQRSKGATRVAA